MWLLRKFQFIFLSLIEFFIIIDVQGQLRNPEWLCMVLERDFLNFLLKITSEIPSLLEITLWELIIKF